MHNHLSPTYRSIIDCAKFDLLHVSDLVTLRNIKPKVPNPTPNYKGHSSPVGIIMKALLTQKHTVLWLKLTKRKIRFKSSKKYTILSHPLSGPKTDKMSHALD